MIKNNKEKGKKTKIMPLFMTRSAQMFEQIKLPLDLKPSDPRFGVGPSLVPKEFLEKLAQTGTSLVGTSHRQKAVRDLVAQMQQGVRDYFKLPNDYEIVLGNGGATFLFDMIGLGLVEKKSAHFTCGEFSQKWFKSHNKIPWIEAEEFAVDYGKGIYPLSVDDADMICCTLNETSTGVMLTEVPDLRESDKLLAIDATSGAGQIKVDFNKVDLYFFSPQKVFAAEGGFFIVIMSPKAIARYEKLQNRQSYIPEVMSWKNAIENSRKNQTYNTPSISNIFFINEQLKKMNALGEEKVISLAKEKAELIYAWAQQKPYLSCFVEDEQFRSQTVATIDVDEKYPVSELTTFLRKENFILDIEGYRKLGRNQLRISLFHNVKKEDLQKLTQIISYCIERS